jgi:hypothetical protein
MVASRRTWLVLLLLCAAGCAKGFNAAASAPPLASAQEAAGVGSSGPSAMYTGDECVTVGERVPCVCTDGVGQGIKACAADKNSPTQGTYSECTACVAIPEAGRPPIVENTGRTANAGRAARGGAGGTTGAAGTGSTSSSARAGSGGRGSTAAAGRSGGTTTTSGRCNCTQDCFPVGILACCRLDNSCGCSWAPGAYCL